MEGTSETRILDINRQANLTSSDTAYGRALGSGGVQFVLLGLTILKGVQGTRGKEAGPLLVT